VTARAYAIADIHGHLDALARAHALIAADIARTGEPAPVVHLGDLVDRGPESAAVVEYLRMGPATGGPWIVLRGNHDYLFRLFLEDGDATADWLRNPAFGAAATLRSYGVDPAPDRNPDDLRAEALARVPPAHLAFLDSLPCLWRTEDAAFAHAGIRPGVPLIAQAPQDLMWIRKGFLEDARDHGPLVVHGHTVLPAPRHHGNRVNLDGGAGYGRPLHPAVIEGRTVWLLTEDGREPLLPLP
jgi:serine/threonine protein phosphatase 1